LLVVRELLCGSRRFNDIRRGIPRISRTVLSERLQALVAAGAIIRTDGAHGPEYELTEAGRELGGIVGALGSWGQKWLPRQAKDEDLDLEPVLVDMARRVRVSGIPKEPFVIRIAIARNSPRFLLVSAAGPAACTQNPGFPEPLCMRGPLSALVAWWRGDATFPAAQRLGLSISGPKKLVREFPDWFERYAFAAISPAEVRPT
jgi:DNA-binding HxlR family transcriptional regulator